MNLVISFNLKFHHNLMDPTYLVLNQYLTRYLNLKGKIILLFEYQKK